MIKNYECIERTTKRDDGSPDGVSIAAILVSKKEGTKKLVLIQEFRPPLGKFVIEFPAGLTEGTNVYEDASRELKEETGFVTSEVIDVIECPVAGDDPSLLASTDRLIVMKIDADDE